MPGVNVIDGEGTYLLWLDFRGTGIDADELDKSDHLRREAVAGQRKDLRKDRTGFQRINVAAPRKTIEECMERIKKVLLDLEICAYACHKEFVYRLERNCFRVRVAI